MSTHEILGKKIGVYRIGQMYRRNKKCLLGRQRDMPVGFGNFTIGQLQRILNDILLYPERIRTKYEFSHGQYFVDIYIPEPDEEENPQPPQ